MIPLPRAKLRLCVAGPITWGCTPLQIGLGGCPWRVAVASMLMNRTRRVVAEPVLRRLLAQWPTAIALGTAEQSEVEATVRPLGFQLQRSRRLVRFSSLYSGDGWEDLRDLPGVGDYVADAVSLCVFGCTELSSSDGAMRAHADALLETVVEYDCREGDGRELVFGEGNSNMSVD